MAEAGLPDLRTACGVFSNSGSGVGGSNSDCGMGSGAGGSNAGSGASGSSGAVAAMLSVVLVAASPQCCGWCLALAWVSGVLYAGSGSQAVLYGLAAMLCPIPGSTY